MHISIFGRFAALLTCFSLFGSIYLIKKKRQFVNGVLLLIGNLISASLHLEGFQWNGTWFKLA